MPTTDARIEPRTPTDLVLEAIALRHQIVVLKRSGTRRLCFRLWDRLFWIFLSWCWPNWHESLLIVQPATVQRWRHNGWSGLWRYRSRGRWRGGRPRVSREVRCLITRMARENFLWGAPRIHGELLMLGLPSLSSNGFALPVDFRPEPEPVVANVYSQSGDCLRRPGQFGA